MSSPGGPLVSGFADTPYLPPIAPYVLPNLPFDDLLYNYGSDVSWQRSHLCPCTYTSDPIGSPDPQCQNCHGRAWYWDAPVGPFRALITFIHMSPTPDEPGTVMDTKWGNAVVTEPTLTIPFSSPIGMSPSGIWAEASINDVFTQNNAIDRYEVQLQVGRNINVPYQQNVSIPTSGAVTVYDTVNHVVDIVSGYTVSGTSVILPATYATGTPYIVSYTAAKAFVAWRPAGSFGHDRPFGNLTLPKRFRLQALDLWLRGSGKV